MLVSEPILEHIEIFLRNLRSSSQWSITGYLGDSEGKLNNPQAEQWLDQLALILTDYMTDPTLSNKDVI